MPGRDSIFDAALDPLHGRESADLSDVGRLARPGRDRSLTGHDQQPLRLGAAQLGIGARSVGQKLLQNALLVVREGAGQRGEMHEVRGEPGHRRLQGGNAAEELLDPETGKGGAAGQDEEPFRHHFFSPVGGEYIVIGNCATLAPLSSAVILLTPCFLTSSMRSTEWSGTKVRFTPANSLLMRSS